MQRWRGTAFWLLAWCWSAVVWLVLVDSAKLPELLAGIVAAALAATATELARRQRAAAIAIAPRLLRSAWRPLAGAVPDVGRLTIAAFAQLIQRRQARGRVTAIPFGHGEDEPRANGRRALALALGSFAPNTIVAGVDPDGHRLIAHQLEPTTDPEDLDPLRLR
jgi:Na+/H+ ion antiporter subunit